MNLQLHFKNSSLSIALSLILALVLLLNSVVIAEAHYDDMGNPKDECPESLLLKGKELLEQVPDISAQFTGGSNSETEASEQSWFSPRLPDWIEMPSWSWPSFESVSTRNEGESVGDSSDTDKRLEVSEGSLDASQFDSNVWVDKAEALLKSHGFEDTDGDGNLNWPDDSPLVGGQNLDIVVVVTESSGVVIGFVPIAGDAVDVVAIVIAKDPITGECLSKTDQLLFALSLLLIVPVSAGTLKLIGKQIGRSEVDLPKVWGALQGTLDELEFETHTWFNRLDNSFSWTFRNVGSLRKFNRVAPKYRKYRVVLGSGATSSSKLAMELGYRTKRFSKSNYRDSLITFTGRNKDEVSGLEAHHILPQDLEKKFTESGIETIHDPRLLVWVDPAEHHGWSKSYNKAWETFFEENPRPTQLEILEEAQALAEDYGYDVLFRTSSWNPFWQVRWPFGS